MPDTPSLLVPASSPRRAVTATRRAFVSPAAETLDPEQVYDADEVGAVLVEDGRAIALDAGPRRARLRGATVRAAPPAWRLHRRRFSGLLADAAPFDALSDRLRDEIAQLARWRSIAPGGRLFSEGQKLDRAFVVAQGRVDLWAAGTLGVARPGSALGIVSALGGSGAAANAVSPTGASLLEIPFALLAEAALCEPSFRDRLLRLGRLRERSRLLSASGFAELLGPESRSALAALFEPRLLGRGEPVLLPGEVQNGIVVVEEGSVGLVLRAGAGPARPVAVAGPGEALGTIAALRGRPCSAGLRALEESRVSLLDRAAFDLLVDWSPSLAGLPAVLAARGELIAGSFFAMRGSAPAVPAWLDPAEAGLLGADEPIPGSAARRREGVRPRMALSVG